MDVSQILGASGLLGILAAVLVGTLFVVVQPIWSIVDCVDSDRDRDAKILVSLAVICTWSLGGAIYGLFFAVSRNLRRFTAVTVVLTFLFAVGGMGACTLGAFRAAEQRQAEQARAQARAVQAIAAFRPAPIADDAVAPFPALLRVGSGPAPAVSVVEFTLAGPIAATARDVEDDVRHVTPGPRALYALTDHAFGAISPETGRLVKIAVDPTLGEAFSWPKGVAFDAEAGDVVVMTSHVFTRFFRYHPPSSAWTLLPAEHRDTPREALAWLAADGLLYAVGAERGASRLAALHRYNARGASVGPLALDPPIPLPPERDGPFQLHASSGRIVLLVPPSARPPGEAAAEPGSPRLFAIDPASGAVSAVR